MNDKTVRYENDNIIYNVSDIHLPAERFVITIVVDIHNHFTTVVMTYQFSLFLGGKHWLLNSL